MDGHTLTAPPDISASSHVAGLVRRTRQAGPEWWFGVAAQKMSVGGFTVVSVIIPGVTTPPPSGCSGGALARETLAQEEPGSPDELGEARRAEAGQAGPALIRHGSNGHGLKGRERGRAGLQADGAEPERCGAGLNGAGLERAGAVRRELARRGLGEVELSQLEFAVVDLETTGWSPGAAAIMEIGAVRVGGGPRPGEFARLGEFASLVNPGVPVPQGIADLTGINDWMLAAAPRLGAVLPGLLDFARGCVLVAHNAPFDVGFLVAGCADCGLAWPGFTVLDTVMLARQVMDPDEVPDCKLGTLAGFFGARTAPSHRALSDARATADVLGWLIRRLAHRGIRTLNQLSAWPDVVA